MVVTASSSSFVYSSRSPSSFTTSLLAAASIVAISTIAVLQRQRRRRNRHPRGVSFDREWDEEDSEASRLLPSTSTKDDPGDNEKKNGKHIRVTLEEEMLTAGGSLTIQPIGVVRSVYRLCVGTPRQGLLAPNARGRIDLNNIGKDAVLGLQEYSHIWIFFIFHLNTLPKKKEQKSSGGANGSNNNNNNNINGRRGVPLKISPPALGGSKVGVLSTRSPHRPNPIGMTLARLDGIETSKKKNGGSKTAAATVTSLYISGLDLVDGTPVIDIKPYVPHYDSPYHYPMISSPSLLLPSEQDSTPPHCRLPPWVADGLATKRPVHFLPRALSDLQCIFDANPIALEFYGGNSSSSGGNNNNETAQEGLDNIKACIEQVLAIDVRSRWQSTKSRRGKFQAERARRVQQTYSTATSAGNGLTDNDDTERSTHVDNNKSNNDTVVNGDIDNSEEMLGETYCTQQLDRLLIHYKVSVPDEMCRPTSSAGSGAEDLVQVISIELLSLQTT
jgi:tRNA (Thr-GGU) A37 N-methylase